MVRLIYVLSITRWIWRMCCWLCVQLWVSTSRPLKRSLLVTCLWENLLRCCMLVFFRAQGRGLDAQGHRKGNQKGCPGEPAVS
mmetsp:Transcript_69235/g.166023  ORF Transcript_69235/g.166023 Transcript_69235/m.166023 type:complete len:83 (-) Transcript_69235:2-250(-)